MPAWSFMRGPFNVTYRGHCVLVVRNGPRQFQYLHTISTNHAELAPLRKQLKDDIKAARTQPVAGSAIGDIDPDILSQWRLTVGIEIHAQLNTARKLFSPSPSESDTEPNSTLSGFDISLPGSQPRFQIAALIPALRAALALNCKIQPVSCFDRKHYFYHDQPAGYQVTQYYHPLALDGSLLLNQDDGLPEEDGDGLLVGIKQIQMEQDTAKTQELEDHTNLIDFGRSGQALVEIISLPHLHSPEAAAAYIRKIQAILFSVDAVVTGMELGGLRADVNVSVRRSGQEGGGFSYSGVKRLGQRTEIKNLNSFKAVEEAVRAERNRQIQVLTAGGVVEGETRGWSQADPHQTRRLRGKEGEVDYRYMPDPDLAPLHIDKGLVTFLHDTLPPIPGQLTAMLVKDHGLSMVDAKSLLALDDGQRLIYFQEVAHYVAQNSSSDSQSLGKVTANWVLHELGSLLTNADLVWTPSLVPASSMARIIELQLDNKITGTSAKSLLRLVLDGSHESVDSIVEENGLWFYAMTDSDYDSLVTTVINNNQIVVDDITRKGRVGKIKFLVGQIMKTGDRNRIEAAKAESILRQRLIGG